MDRSVKFWGVVAGMLASALVLGTFVSRSVAATEVAPVANRVTRLEAQREEDRAKLDELRSDVKEVLRRLSPR